MIMNAQVLSASTGGPKPPGPSDVMLDPILDKGQRTVGTFCAAMPSCCHMLSGSYIHLVASMARLTCGSCFVCILRHSTHSLVCNVYLLYLNVLYAFADIAHLLWSAMCTCYILK